MLTITSADFHHKGRGQALWLTNAPEWVEKRLPELTKQKFEERVISSLFCSVALTLLYGNVSNNTRLSNLTRD